jgi:hypothetical protein
MISRRFLLASLVSGVAAFACRESPRQGAGSSPAARSADPGVRRVPAAPAAMWSASSSASVGDLRHLNLTVWQLQSGGDDQVNVGLQLGDELHQIATVKGGPTGGKGTARVRPAGESGSITVTGQDGTGADLQLMVECQRFTEAVAEGG